MIDAAILRDMGSATTFTRQMAEIQKQARKTMRFDAATLHSFDVTEAHVAGPIEMLHTDEARPNKSRHHRVRR